MNKDWKICSVEKQKNGNYFISAESEKDDLAMYFDLEYMVNDYIRYLKRNSKRNYNKLIKFLTGELE